MFKTVPIMEYIKMKRMFLNKHGNSYELQETYTDTGTFTNRTYKCPDGATWTETLTLVKKPCGVKLEEIEVSMNLSLIQTHFANTDSEEEFVAFEPNNS
jgi:hypothetical protein